MRDDKGGAISIKPDSAPIGPAWSGWLAIRNRSTAVEATAEEFGADENPCSYDRFAHGYPVRKEFAYIPRPACNLAGSGGRNGGANGAH